MTRSFSILGIGIEIDTSDTKWWWRRQFTEMAYRLRLRKRPKRPKLTTRGDFIAERWSQDARDAAQMNTVIHDAVVRTWVVPTVYGDMVHIQGVPPDAERKGEQE